MWMFLSTLGCYSLSLYEMTTLDTGSNSATAPAGIDRYSRLADHCSISWEAILAVEGLNLKIGPVTSNL